MEPENIVSTGNLILFAIALFGAVASFSRPIAKLSENTPAWNPWNLSIPAFAGYLWLLLLSILFAPILGDLLNSTLLPSHADDERTLSIFATLTMQTGLICVILLAVRYRKWPLRSFFESFGTSWARVFRHTVHLFFRYLPAIWLVGLFWNSLLILLDWLGYGIETEPQIAAQWIAESNSIPFLVIMGVMVVITAPISEELVFRGFLYRFLRERGSVWVALIISSLLFGVLHASLHSFLPLFFIGLLLVKLYEETKDIRTPILFHLFFNLFSYLNLLFLPSL